MLTLLSYVRAYDIVHDIVFIAHGVSIPELKKSTNLKIHLKPSVQDVWQNLDSGRYTVGGTLVGKAVQKLNFGSLGGWLLRGRVSEKQPSEVGAGPPLGAKASRSKIQKWSVTQTANI